MGLPDYVQLSKWLSLFGENIAVAMIVVVLYAAIRPVVSEKRPRWASTAIGLIFGLSAIVSMGTPFIFADGIRLDMRNVFVLVGSLSGGPIGGAVSSLLAIAYRVYLGGAGTEIGIGGIIIAALIGVIIARRYGSRVRELGIGPLLIVGAATAIINDLYGRIIFNLKGVHFIPPEAVIALFAVSTIGTALLGIAINATHYRVWRRTQRQLIDIFETTSDLIWETDTEGRFTLMSGQVHAILGYQPAEIVEQTNRIFGGRWQDEVTDVAYKTAIKARLPFNELKYHLRAKDGSPKIVSVSSRPAFDQHGQFVGFRGTASDITARELATAELQKRDEQLRVTREHLARAQHVGNIGSIEVDLATETAIWSDELFRLLGLAPDGDTSFERFLASVHPDDRADMTADRDALARGENLTPREYRFLRPDDESRLLRRQVEVIRDAVGSPIRHVSTYVDVTAIRHTEAELIGRDTELLESRAHLALAQQVANLASGEVDLITGQVFVSPMTYQVLGLDPVRDPMGYDMMLAHTHPDDHAFVAEIYRRTRLGEDTDPIEFRFIRPDGEVIWLRRVAQIRRDETGKGLKVISTLLDISDRKRIEIELRGREERLRLSEQHLASAQRVGRMGSVEVDAVTGHTVWSTELYHLLGFDPTAGQPTGDQYYAIVHPADRDLLRKLRADELAHGRSTPVDYRLLGPGGKIRWLHRQAKLRHDADGRPSRWIIVHQDVTDRRRIEADLVDREEQLRHSRDHLARAQEVAAVASTEVDLKTQKGYWSDHAYRLFGLDPDGTVPSAESFLAIVHPEDLERMRAITMAARRGEETGPSEFRILHSKGEIRWLYRVSDIIRDADGKPVQVIATIHDITERKKAGATLLEREAQLRQTSERLALAQQVARLGSIEMDFRTGNIQWSDEIYSILGLDPSTTVPSIEQFRSVLYPDDRAKFDLVGQRVLDGEDIEPSELRIVWPNGETRWLFRSIRIFCDESGKPLKSVATLHDITERKQAEIALLERETQLRQSGERLALAQQIAKLGSMERDYRTNAIQWSDEVYRIFGLDPSTTAPSVANFRAVIHPDDLPLFDLMGQRILDGLDVKPGELRIVRPDGEIRWIFRARRVLHDEHGVPIKSVATLQDVTERRQIDDELRRSREHLALGQRVASIGSGELDLRTGQTRWTDEWFAILGLDSATTAANAETFFARVHPDDRDMVQLRGRRSAAGQLNEPMEYRIVRPDGEIRWVYTRTTIIQGEDGQAGTAIATLQDVTHRKKAQLERLELERQLTQAQKMEAVGNLTGGVAHDFNNLLSVILGRLEMVEAELVERPTLREWIRTCISAANRGAALTRSMLAFSRQQPLKPAEIDLPSAIDNVIIMLPRTLGETIEVVTQNAPDLWRCEADPSQLQNALLNLALNARDAMPDGGKLTIEAANAHLDDDYAVQNPDVIPGDYVELAVSDTGAGMPADTIARAFEPFFTTKEVGKGSGLGLSMVYGFVKQSGGHVKIYSEVGLGTTVRIYLPRSSGTLPPKESAVDRQVALVGTGTIVVVEDDDDMRALAVTQLERLGYTVWSAATASAALETVAQHPEAVLLLTDMTLPGAFNGRQLAEQAVARLPHLRVLYMSGYSENTIIHHGRLDADVRLLQKPFSIHELSEALRAALQ